MAFSAPHQGPTLAARLGESSAAGRSNAAARVAAGWLCECSSTGQATLQMQGDFSWRDSATHTGSVLQRTDDQTVHAAQSGDHTARGCMVRRRQDCVPVSIALSLVFIRPGDKPICSWPTTVGVTPPTHQKLAAFACRFASARVKCNIACAHKLCCPATGVPPVIFR